MTRIDWFTIVSGSVGFVTDIITLSAILFLSNTNTIAPFSVWILTACSITVTILMLGFYSRRYFTKRHYKKLFGSARDRDSEYIDENSAKDAYIFYCRRIEIGAASISTIAGLILFTSFFLSLMISISVQNFATQADLGGIILGSLVFGGFFAFIISSVLDHIAKNIYKAFDIMYLI